MAADLHIHIYDGLTEDHMRIFFSNTMGSKWFNPVSFNNSRFDSKEYREVADSENIWVGEVSWLKAAFLEDGDTFIPTTVQQVSEAVGEDLPEIDDDLIAKIMTAFAQENKTEYALAKQEDLLHWLECNRGKKVFTISW